MDKFLKKIANLITVKTIVTLLLTGVFCKLALNNIISGEQFLIIFTTIISFYFGTQHEKKNTENTENKEEKEE